MYFAGGDTKNANDVPQAAVTSPQTPEKATPTPAPQPPPTPPPSLPSGVNRRTAVLFTKKLNKTMTPTTANVSQRKGRPPRLKNQVDLHDANSGQVFPETSKSSGASANSAGSGGSSGGRSSSGGGSAGRSGSVSGAGASSSAVTSPVSTTGGRKRAASATSVASVNDRDLQPPPTKRGTVPPPTEVAISNINNSTEATANIQPTNSFTQYRIDPTNSFSESDSTSDISSGDESLSDTSSGHSSSHSRAGRAV